MKPGFTVKEHEMLGRDMSRQDFDALAIWIQERFPKNHPVYRAVKQLLVAHLKLRSALDEEVCSLFEKDKKGFRGQDPTEIYFGARGTTQRQQDQLHRFLSD